LGWIQEVGLLGERVIVPDIDHFPFNWVVFFLIFPLKYDSTVHSLIKTSCGQTFGFLPI
jgi:hypothetical protein